MKARFLTKILAVACIVASLPLALITFPWLPATILEFAQLQHDAAPWGTESYHRDRERRLERDKVALLLYALSAAALLGLAAVVAKTLPFWLECGIWLLTAGTGIAIPQFQKPLIGPQTSAFYVAISVYLPIAVAITATVGALTCAGRRILHRNEAPPAVLGKTV